METHRRMAMNQRPGFSLASTLVLAALLFGCGPHRSVQSVHPPKAPPPAPTEPQSAPKTASAGAESTSDSKEGLEILSSTQGVDFAPYVQQLLKLVKAYWYNAMPQEARAGAKGKVSLLFTIRFDGTVSSEDPRIETSSGVDVLDKAAVDAIRKSEPFDPLPREFRGPYLKLRIVFLYNIKPNL